MIFKYTFLGDNIIVNIPNNEYWELRFKLFSGMGDDDYNLYLSYKDKEIVILETDFFTDGRPELPYEAVGSLYEEIVDVVYKKMESNPNLNIIDIDSIQSELLEEKYIQLWVDKNYIEIDSDGTW